MNKRQTREFNTILGTREFLRAQGLETGAFRPIAATLDDVVKRVNALSVATFLPATRAQSKAIRQSADDLRREHMIPVSRRGKIIFRGDVGIENALRVPHAKDKPASVIVAARTMIKNIRPHRALFIEAGFPRTFLTGMRDAATKLAATIKVAEKKRESTPESFAELRRQIARGRKEVGAADGLMLAWMHTKPAHDRKALAVMWRAAHRITARIGRPSKRSRSA